MDLGIAFTEDGQEVHLFGGLVKDLTCVAGVVAGRVMAIGGQSGAGKSTTTAALALRGYPLFSDDVLGWRSNGGQLLACPRPGAGETVAGFTRRL